MNFVVDLLEKFCEWPFEQFWTKIPYQDIALNTFCGNPNYQSNTWYNIVTIICSENIKSLAGVPISTISTIPEPELHNDVIKGKLKLSMALSNLPRNLITGHYRKNCEYFVFIASVFLDSETQSVYHGFTLIELRLPLWET